MGRKPGRGRERMLDSTIALLRERGMSGATIDGALTHSGASRGSFYHYFPGGRNEMIFSAAERAGAFISALIDQLDHPDPQVMIDGFIGAWRWAMVESDYRAGCPIVAIAVDSDLPGAVELARATFELWQEKLARRLVLNGFPDDRARRLATLAVGAIEGAVILCRARGDIGPLEDIFEEIAPLFAAPPR